MKSSGMFRDLRHAYAYRYESEQFRILAMLWWYFLLLVTPCVIVISMVLGVMLMQDSQTSGPTASKLDTATSTTPLDKERLSRVLGVFDARAMTYQTLKIAPAIADPSK